MKKIVIEKNQSEQRLDKFLHKYLPSAGSGFLYKMLRKKNITLNGKRVEGKEILHIGDEIVFYLSDDTVAKFKQSNLHTNEQEKEYLRAYHTLKGITLLYEDEDVILLSKPQGILSQKALDKDLSLNEWLLGYLLAEKKFAISDYSDFKPSICNRLDRNTSGIVLCGKSLLGSQGLNSLLKDRRVEKRYYAIVLGSLKEPYQLDGYLTKNRTSNTVRYDKMQGEEYIRTDIQPLRVGNQLSLVEAHLITGKTHQIRAHLASIKHPILGDNKYGDKEWNKTYRKQYDGLKYQQLHAYKITFPESLKCLPQLSGRTFVSPMPKVFEQICEDIL